MNIKSVNQGLLLILFVVHVLLRMYMKFNEATGLEPVRDVLSVLILLSLLVKLGYWLLEKYQQRKADSHL